MRAVSDFNIHIPEKPCLDQDSDHSSFNIFKAADRLIRDKKKINVTLGNVMIMDSTFLDTQDTATSFCRKVIAQGLTLTALIDITNKNFLEQIEFAGTIGVSGIKFHPYSQNIAPVAYPAITSACELAQSLGLWIAVCCSYGTKNLYEYSGVRLLAHLSRSGIEDTPLIALHSGGPAVLDVMSIALDSSNIFLETSFSIPYWNGSSVEKDLAFAIHKVGPSRCLYGSDTPYMAFDKSITSCVSFLKKYGFDVKAVDAIMSNNFEQLIGK